MYRCVSIEWGLTIEKDKRAKKKGYDQKEGKEVELACVGENFQPQQNCDTPTHTVEMKKKTYKENNQTIVQKNETQTNTSSQKGNQQT